MHLHPQCKLCCWEKEALTCQVSGASPLPFLEQPCAPRASSSAQPTALELTSPLPQGLAPLPLPFPHTCSPVRGGGQSRVLSEKIRWSGKGFSCSCVWDSSGVSPSPSIHPIPLSSFPAAMGSPEHRGTAAR